MRLGPRASGASTVSMTTATAGPGAKRVRGRAPGPAVAGRVFGAMTVLPAVLAVAWLLPALPLLLAARLSAVPMVFMAVPLALALCYLTLPQVPARWPAPLRRRTDRAPDVPWWAVAGTVVVAVAFAAWQFWMRTQQIIYLRDPSTYLQVGYWIAHHGTLPVPSSLPSFGGSHPGLSFASMDYYPRGTGIVPQFMTGFPVLVAAAVWIGGIPAALMLTPIVGGCAILAFGGLAGRLIGPRWAPAAALVLALSLPEIYTSRSTFSEPLAQVLLFGGLSMLTDSLLPRLRANRATANGPTPDDRFGNMGVAAVAGLTLGMTIFVRLDGLSDILPVVPFAGVLIAARRRQAIAFVIGLAIGVGYGVLDGYQLSRPYLDLEAPSLHPLALIASVAVLITVIGVVVAVTPRIYRPFRAIMPLARRWLPHVVAALAVLAFVAFAVRPLVQKVAGETNPASIAYVAELQKLGGLPVDGRQQYYQDSLYWVIWYIGLPAVLLGGIGLALLARQGVRALLTWRDQDGSVRIWVLPLMMALWVIVTVLWRPAVSPDQPWASRRLVPFVLPGLILGAVWVAAWLKAWAAELGAVKLTSAAVAWCCVAALGIPAAWTTFGIGLSPRLTSHGMAFKRIGAGELTAVRKLCGKIGPNASVVILDQLTADRFAQVVRGMCDTPAAVLDDPTSQRVATVVTAISSAGRRPVLLAGNQPELTAYGGTPSEVVNLLTTQEAHVLTAPPTRTWGIHYTVWLSVPALSQV